MFDCTPNSSFMLAYRSLQGDRNTIHKNLSLCLFIANLIFILGIMQTDNRVSRFLQFQTVDLILQDCCIVFLQRWPISACIWSLGCGWRRWYVRWLLVCCTTSSWLRLCGCCWRECSCTLCSCKCLSRSVDATSTSTCVAMVCTATFHCMQLYNTCVHVE